MSFVQHVFGVKILVLNERKPLEKYSVLRLPVPCPISFTIITLNVYATTHIIPKLNLIMVHIGGYPVQIYFEKIKFDRQSHGWESCNMKGAPISQVYYQHRDCWVSRRRPVSVSFKSFNDDRELSDHEGEGTLDNHINIFGL